MAALLDLSATVHASAPLSLPTPSKILRALGNSRSTAGGPEAQEAETSVHPSALHSVANAMVVPPIHVDHVAEAICVAADGEREDVRGVVDVSGMRRLIGWEQMGTGDGRVVHA
jgi:hypothetical protein